jgi:hypothetical protein
MITVELDADAGHEEFLNAELFKNSRHKNRSFLRASMRQLMASFGLQCPSLEHDFPLPVYSAVKERNP